jgi:hypothetical protein
MAVSVGLVVDVDGAAVGLLDLSIVLEWTPDVDDSTSSVTTDHTLVDDLVLTVVSSDG